MNRLFAFGCSFTRYGWPTWADIMALDKGVDFYNFAIAGLGNVGIASRVFEADAKFNFTKDDKIVILWSGFERFDWITNTHWENYGSVFHAPKERRFWHQRNWSVTNDIVRNYTSILSVNKSYAKNILWQAHAFDPILAEHGLSNIRYSEQDLRIAKGLKSLYDKKLPDITVKQFDDVKPSFKIIEDIHPDITSHKNLLIQNVYKDLGWKLSESTHKFIDRLQHDVEIYVQTNRIKDSHKLQDWLCRELTKNPKYARIHRLFKPYELPDYVY
jgi:hypothetical protein